MPSLATKLSGALLLTTLLVGSLACDGNSSTSPNPQPQLTIRMTDAPTDEASQVNVYISGLTLKPSGAPVVRIASDIGLVDLLSLRATTRDLATIGVTPGSYEYVQVELDQSRSSVVERASGAIRPLQIASGEVKVLGGFVVPEAGGAVVTLDFDAAASLNHLGNGNWLLTPVIVKIGG